MITIYKNLAANAIFIEDANGSQFINSIQATTDDPTSTKMNIFDLVEQIYLVYQEEFTEFLNENGQQWGPDANETINALNAIFQNSGTPTGNLPTITSSLTISLVQGQVLNYELTASDGVGYEWDFSNVSGVTTVDGNIRKIIGGSSLGVGTYNIPIKAINYNGEDLETIVLTVSNPSFANTKSVIFNTNDYLQANAGILQNVLGRAGNGAGASDAWSISFWIKPSTNGNNQGILLFGGVYTSSQAVIDIRHVGNKDSLWIRYGTPFNRLQLQTPDNSLPANSWSHCLISYDGGTTGASSGSINSYYGRFNMFINGVSQATTGTNNNFGYTGAISASVLQVGKSGQGQYLRGVNLDELAIWDSDESSNITDIYNGGTPSDLSLLSSSPVHWWRMGDGDTFPFLFDSGNASNCIFQMQNMTSADIVNDVP